MTRFAAGASFKNKMAGFMPDAVDFGSMGARNIGVQKTLEGNQLVKDAEVQYTRDLADARIATNDANLAASNAQSSANAFNTILGGVSSGLSGPISSFVKRGGFNGNSGGGGLQAFGNTLGSQATNAFDYSPFNSINDRGAADIGGMAGSVPFAYIPS